MVLLRSKVLITHTVSNRTLTTIQTNLGFLKHRLDDRDLVYRSLAKDLRRKFAASESTFVPKSDESDSRAREHAA
jgi:nitrate reductase assembly molybdenum cofactor insertion protein NarJ